MKLIICENYDEVMEQAAQITIDIISIILVFFPTNEDFCNFSTETTLFGIEIQKSISFLPMYLSRFLINAGYDSANCRMVLKLCSGLFIILSFGFVVNLSPWHKDYKMNFFVF